MTDQHCSSRFVYLLQSRIGKLQPRCHQAHDDLEAAPWVPEVRMVCRGFVLLGREHALKTQSGAARNVFKGSTRHHHDVVTAGPQGAADADEWMNVAARSNGSQDEAHSVCNP